MRLIILYPYFGETMRKLNDLANDLEIVWRGEQILNCLSSADCNKRTNEAKHQNGKDKKEKKKKKLKKSTHP